MPNMRLVYDNPADVATLAASTTAGSLAVTNLQDDRKGQIHRSTGTSVQYTVTWLSGKLVKMVALAFSNLTATATMRVRGYAVATDLTPLFDVAAAPCAPAPFAARQDNEQPALGVALSAYGGYSHAVRWFTGGSVQKLVIDVADPSNPAGYVEAARLIAGNYWSPTYNPDYGAGLAFPDATKNTRTEAGDLLSERGTRGKKLTLNHSLMPTADRQTMMDLFQVNGLSMPVFVSLFPEDAEPGREQKYMLFGKLSQMSQTQLSSYNRYQWPLEFEEV